MKTENAMLHVAAAAFIRRYYSILVYELNFILVQELVEHRLLTHILYIYNANIPNTKNVRTRIV